MLYVLDVTSFAATGAFLLADRRTGRLGWGMIGAAFCYAVSWWWIWPSSWQTGPAPIVSFVLGYGWFVVGGLALVRYPEPALTRRSERTYFAALAIWVFGGKLAVAAVSEPEWKRWNPHAWWPTVSADRHLFRLTDSIVGAGITVLALMLPVLLLLKIRRSRRLERADMLPATVAAVAIGVVGGIYLTALQLHLTGHLTDALRALIALAALVAPIAFIVSLIQRRLAVGSVASLIGPLAGCRTIGDVEHALRQKLDDPALVLAVRTGASGYLSRDGYPLPPTVATRWPVDVRAPGGRPIAVLLVDPDLRRLAPAVHIAAQAAGIVLDNGILQHDLADRLGDSQQSRRRLTQSALSERQRIGHELHDGVQASLQAVKLHLGRARLHFRRHRQAHDDRHRTQQLADASTAVEDAQAALRRAVEDLRSLARGIYPEALEDGLRAALQRVLRSLPLQVTLQIDEARAAREVELLMYLLICEAVTNVVKHAGVTQARVTTAVADGVALVRVSDHGCGGARPSPGSGLAALTERVRSLRGDLTVTSAPGHGTVVEAVIPCG
ncbi:hypothetical protein Dvina_16270 [Dactylosporangium vinaceum]|uniref:histidine kinase n=1 Tax=Dactylosporangium vinaceum TaxID=53362 RepID=A0ABV5M915_9ACTN|nr:histidine kinase [Dactylosporangium vinaceum]UAB99484.1 hypothetical protein Dvina_16270 [Dactylosporangium vinaceum]